MIKKWLKNKRDRWIRKSDVYQKLLKESGMCVADNIRLKRENDQFKQAMEFIKLSAAKTRGKRGNNNG